MSANRRAGDAPKSLPKEAPHEALSRPRRRRRSQTVDRLLFGAIRGRAVGHQARLCQVDARRSAREFRRSRRAVGSRASIISAFRSRPATSCTRSMAGCARPAATSSSRGKRAAATPNRKSPGSTIRPEFPGRRFTRQATAPITATGPASVLRDSLTRNRVARRRRRSRSLPPPAAVS